MKTPLKKFTVPNYDSNKQGMFGATRKYDIHTGIDLYCEENDRVYSEVDGVVHKIHPFTGAIANSPWWNDTYAIMIYHIMIHIIHLIPGFSDQFYVYDTALIVQYTAT